MRHVLLLALILLPGCTLVGYPSGSVPDVQLPPPGPISGDAVRPRPDRTASHGPADGGSERTGTPEIPDRDVDPEAVVDAEVEPLRDTPADLTDAGRRYEVFGVEYRVLDTPVGYQAEGVASWYGEAFNGRPTASGEIYDMNGYSAAHRTLPLHTWVEVTNLDNGRRVVVKVNDRGPFVDTDERLIDVSLGAARRLEMLGPGLARVRIRAVEPPTGSGRPGL